MATLRDNFPLFWGDKVCCESWRQLFLACAEEDGYMAGALDVRKYPNDGKDVWRNYERVRVSFCPFCGAKQEWRS
jgi:hypothetical protein